MQKDGGMISLQRRDRFNAKQGLAHGLCVREEPEPNLPFHSDRDLAHEDFPDEFLRERTR